VKEYETVVFECEISKANVKAKWFKGQQEIKDVKRYTITVVGQKHTLTVLEVELTDADKYEIVFEEGVTSTAQLTVEGNSLSLIFAHLFFRVYIFFMMASLNDIRLEFTIIYM